MARYTHEFCVEREIDGEDVELTLRADLEIEPFVRGLYSGPPENCFPDEGGSAEIDGTILVLNEDWKFEPWSGTLTDDEISRVESEGYKAWEEFEENARVDAEIERYEDREYDYFHDERAIHTTSSGKVFF